jgi:hypothetical protein
MYAADIAVFAVDTLMMLFRYGPLFSMRLLDDEAR